MVSLQVPTGPRKAFINGKPIPGSSRLQCHDLNGRLLWSADSGDDCDPIYVADGKILTICRDNEGVYLAAIYNSSGIRIFQHRLAHQIVGLKASISVDQSRLIFATESYYREEQSVAFDLAVIDYASGRTAWERPLGRPPRDVWKTGVFEVVCDSLADRIAVATTGSTLGEEVEVFLFDGSSALLWRDAFHGCETGLRFVGSDRYLCLCSGDPPGAHLVAAR